MKVERSGSLNRAFDPQKSTNALKKNDRLLQKMLEKLSNARRINRASDDAAGLGIAEILESDVRGFKVASQNLQDAASALSIADGSGSRISEILQRQRELALAARNDTLSDADRVSLDDEYRALTLEIDRVAHESHYNGLHAADGTDLASGVASVHAGSQAEDLVTLPAIDYTSSVSEVSGTSVATSAGATEALSAVDSALESLHEQRAGIGATINRFISAVDNLSISTINTQAAESALRDQDMAEGIAELVRQQLLREGGVRAFGRFGDMNRSYILGILG